MKSVVFDLDGTLADTSADLIAAANACFIKSGDKPPLNATRDARTAFRGGRAMLALGYSRLDMTPPDAQIRADIQYLLKFYAENLDTHSFLYDGVEDCLKMLQSQGYQLGICTNKYEALADDLVKRLGIRNYFSALLGSDSLPVRKPDAGHLLGTIERMGANPSKSVLIGDTATDRDAAKNACVPCVLVTFGSDGHGVADLEPEALLHHYDDLPDLVAQIIKA